MQRAWALHLDDWTQIKENICLGTENTPGCGIGQGGAGQGRAPNFGMSTSENLSMRQYFMKEVVTTQGNNALPHMSTVNSILSIGAITIGANPTSATLSKAE